MEVRFPVPPEHDFWVRCVFARDWCDITPVERDLLYLLGWDRKGVVWHNPGRGFTGNYWCNRKKWTDVYAFAKEQWEQLGFTEALWNCFDHPHRGFEAALRRRIFDRCVIDGEEHFAVPCPSSSSQEARPS